LLASVDTADALGRIVGTKRTGDGGWTCTTYDARGRTTGVFQVGTVPSIGVIRSIVGDLVELRSGIQDH